MALSNMQLDALSKGAWVNAKRKFLNSNIIYARRAGPCYLRNKDGDWELAPTDQPRWGFTESGEPCLHVEPSAINMLTTREAKGADLDDPVTTKLMGLPAQTFTYKGDTDETWFWTPPSANALHGKTIRYVTYTDKPWPDNYDMFGQKPGETAEGPTGVGTRRPVTRKIRDNLYENVCTVEFPADYAGAPWHPYICPAAEDQGFTITISGWQLLGNGAEVGTPVVPETEGKATIRYADTMSFDDVSKVPNDTSLIVAKVRARSDKGLLIIAGSASEGRLVFKSPVDGKGNNWELWGYCTLASDAYRILHRTGMSEADATQTIAFYQALAPAITDAAMRRCIFQSGAGFGEDLPSTISAIPLAHATPILGEGEVEFLAVIEKAPEATNQSDTNLIAEYAKLTELPAPAAVNTTPTHQSGDLLQEHIDLFGWHEPCNRYWILDHQDDKMHLVLGDLDYNGEIISTRDDYNKFLTHFAALRQAMPTILANADKAITGTSTVEDYVTFVKTAVAAEVTKILGG